MSLIVAIFQELNNRELSIIIWLAILFGFLLLKERKSRTSFIRLSEAFFKKAILLTLAVFTLYLALEVFVFSLIIDLTAARMKDLLLWVVYVGFWQIFEFNKIKNAKMFILQSIKSTLVWTLFIEYFLNIYVFSLPLELIFVPLVSCIGILHIFPKKEDEKRVSDFLFVILSYLGYLILIYSSYRFFTDPARPRVESIIQDFLLPICFSIAFLPFVILIWFYSKIEDNYVSVNSLTPKELNPISILKILFILRYNLKLIELWKDSAWRKALKSKEELIKEARSVLSIARKQITYYYSPLTLGFGLQDAKKYLSEFGISVGDYKKLEVDNEAWFACSQYKEFGEGIFKNNIAYYVEGTSDIVKSLKIVANCNSKFNPNEYEFQQFTTPFFKSLFHRAFKTEMPQALIQKVTFFIPFEERFLGKVVQFEKQLWLGNNGYHVSFTIRNEDYLN